ncbi:DUF488 family protein [Staphylococcus aureus]
MSKRTANLVFELRTCPLLSCDNGSNIILNFLELLKKNMKKNYVIQDAQKDAFEKLKDIGTEHNHVLLLYAAKDTKHNQAVVLQQLLNT